MRFVLNLIDKSSQVHFLDGKTTKSAPIHGPLVITTVNATAFHSLYVTRDVAALTFSGAHIKWRLDTLARGTSEIVKSVLRTSDGERREVPFSSFRESFMMRHKTASAPALTYHHRDGMLCRRLRYSPCRFFAFSLGDLYVKFSCCQLFTWARRTGAERKFPGQRVSHDRLWRASHSWRCFRSTRAPSPFENNNLIT